MVGVGLCDALDSVCVSSVSGVGLRLRRVVVVVLGGLWGAGSMVGVRYLLFFGWFCCSFSLVVSCGHRSRALMNCVVDVSCLGVEKGFFALVERVGVCSVILGSRVCLLESVK